MLSNVELAQPQAKIKLGLRTRIRRGSGDEAKRMQSESRNRDCAEGKVGVAAF